MGSDDDLEVIEEQDLGARVVGMIDLLLYGIFA
jgi:hypothetical protein